VDVILVGGVKGNFRRWESEDKPPIAHVDMGQMEHISEEDPVGIGVLAVDDGMRSVEHDDSLLKVVTNTAIAHPVAQILLTGVLETTPRATITKLPLR
jgi:hypothetical protein